MSDLYAFENFKTIVQDGDRERERYIENKGNFEKKKGQESQKNNKILRIGEKKYFKLKKDWNI